MEKNQFRQQLQSRSQKITRQRLAILSVLESSSAPVSAEDIYWQLNDSDSKTSLSTVYRNLERMLAENLIIKQGVLDHKSQYTLRRDTHSHQVICLDCHKTISIAQCPLDIFARQLIDEKGFHLTDHRMELYGYCRECRLLSKEDNND